MAKNFKAAAGDMTGIYSGLLGSAQETQREQEEQKAQEAQEAMESLSTQGRKGLKLPRINVAFTPTNFDYIHIMSAIRGQTMTQFVNGLIEKDIKENGETFKAARLLMDRERNNNGSSL